MYFPSGKLKEGRIVNVAGLAAPFDVEIDAQNRVWVSNSAGDTVIRFPKDDPTKVETFRAGISVHAMAIDSKGNVWVTSNASPDFRCRKCLPASRRWSNGRFSWGLLSPRSSSGRAEVTRSASSVTPSNAISPRGAFKP